MTRTQGVDYSAVIVAAGKGSRFGGYKQLERINGETIVEISLRKFAECGARELILVTKKELFPYFTTLENRFLIPLKIVEGGEQRSDSVYNGVSVAESLYVLVHDAARPNLDCKLIQRIREALLEHPAVIPVIPESDTVAVVEDNYLKKKLDRSSLRRVQTPQGFKNDLLKKAFTIAREKNIYFTDESTMLLEILGIESFVVEGSPWNFKITYREDLEMLKTSKTVMGYDIHRLKNGGLLKVGGVVVKEGISPVAHSDGDVVLHALIDALLSMEGVSDIGTLFPDTDERWKDADSTELLKKVKNRIKDFKILKVDILCKLENVKLAPYREKIKENIANLLDIPSSIVSFKAKRGEGVGPVGEGKAIEAFVLLTYI